MLVRWRTSDKAVMSVGMDDTGGSRSPSLATTPTTGAARAGDVGGRVGIGVGGPSVGKAR